MSCALASDEYHILVADDDAAMRSLVADALRSDGHLIVEVATGAGLLDALTSVILDGAAPRFDLIVSDIRMPLITGLEVLEGLRALGAPVDCILMTAFGDERTHGEAAELGAIAVLDKPFSLDRLRAIVRSCRRCRMMREPGRKGEHVD